MRSFFFLGSYWYSRSWSNELRTVDLLSNDNFLNAVVVIFKESFLRTILFPLGCAEAKVHELAIEVESL
jgi:hypothetical protein